MYEELSRQVYVDDTELERPEWLLVQQCQDPVRQPVQDKVVVCGGEHYPEHEILEYEEDDGSP